MDLAGLADRAKSEGKDTLAAIFIKDYPAPDWFPDPSRKARLGIFTVLAAALLIPILLADPAQAGIGLGGVQDLVDDVRTAVIRVGQGVLALAIAYYLIVVGVSNMSSRALKGIALAGMAIILLEIFDSVILDNVTDIEATDTDADQWD